MLPFLFQSIVRPLASFVYLPGLVSIVSSIWLTSYATKTPTGYQEVVNRIRDRYKKDRHLISFYFFHHPKERALQEAALQRYVFSVLYLISKLDEKGESIPLRLYESVCTGFDQLEKELKEKGQKHKKQAHSWEQRNWEAYFFS